MTDRFIRLRELPSITGISARSVAYLRDRGDFPEPRRLTAKSVGFLESEIMMWMQNRPIAQPDGRSCIRATGETWRGQEAEVAT
ncbi:MAG: AlpA family phage regulatory protein [Candidatus Competibacteraceae bacterium]|uniref:AlpA family transcriptional regulator n=1 Tax=Candidatus Contendobacter odensis Run_B_J11 TaxID=1400861 RepID=A0A7U7GCJ9_9GAMM|nr:AlpA family phage regulatory protein [Candidatus Contendobacter odensis]MBK8534637.1 AlpA family phage regulatory protein [Candidatus Competibacteraceae bacterium]MBK8750937.1 AlpA family phage regulatory protein [Candidatus Competibacteraceae bacterium]CDH45314.1 hypothetical protein BN874_2210002 [Candidatus Contendobacter odensis Run_B_J11]